jgi:hypothetical protein
MYPEFRLETFGAARRTTPFEYVTKRYVVFNNCARHATSEANAIKTIHLFVAVPAIEGPCLWPLFAAHQKYEKRGCV